MKNHKFQARNAYSHVISWRRKRSGEGREWKEKQSILRSSFIIINHDMRCFAAKKASNHHRHETQQFFTRHGLVTSNDRQTRWDTFMIMFFSLPRISKVWLISASISIQRKQKPYQKELQFKHHIDNVICILPFYSWMEKIVNIWEAMPESQLWVKGKCHGNIYFPNNFSKPRHKYWRCEVKEKKLLKCDRFKAAWL